MAEEEVCEKGAAVIAAAPVTKVQEIQPNNILGQIGGIDSNTTNNPPERRADFIRWRLESLNHTLSKGTSE